MTIADTKVDIIEAINLELQGPKMSLDALRDVLKYCEKKNMEQVALFHQSLTAPKPAAKPKPKRKTGVFREVRTIRNRGGSGKTTYKWEYEVTYEDGKRVESKSIGKVK